MVEHNIQREIINRLMFVNSARFSELKPDGMESNIFMYHLNHLLSSKIVIKDENGYRLTEEGLSYVDSLSGSNLKPRKQPKVIAIIALENDQGEWLLLKRKFQPYKDRYMLPSGKQHYGESINLHAKRELFEKTALDIPLKHRGIANIIIKKEDHVLTHVIANIHYSKVSKFDVPNESSKFVYEFINPKNTKIIEMPGTLEVILALNSNSKFINLDIELDS